ncbi:MAG: hypothetical protein LBD06_05530 [Candidatus Accumulibacter sp.]|nr:hypothetical protein [Accumulibacter sp.]
MQEDSNARGSEDSASRGQKTGQLERFAPQADPSSVLSDFCLLKCKL